MIEKTIVFRADRKPNPSFVHIGFETDNMVERLVFVLPSIHVQQIATLMIGGKYVNMAMLAEESGRYYIDLTAELVGAPGRIDAYITIDAPDGKVWNSAPFALVTGDLPDVDGAIQEHFPVAIQQMRQEIAGHRTEMQDQSKAVQEAADRAEKAAEDISDTLNGGTNGQVLTKQDGKAVWADPPAGGGGGDGEPGKDGGYYIPNVSEGGVLSWMPSKPDMPGVPAANIKGKDGSDADVTADNIRIALGYTPADSQKVEQLSEENANLSSKMDAITAPKKVPVPIEFNDEPSYVLSGGKPLAMGSYNPHYLISSPVPVTAGEVVIITAKATHGNYLYAFYDSAEQFVSGEKDFVGGDAGTAAKDKLVVVPEMATTMRISFTGGYQGALKRYGGDEVQLRKWQDKIWCVVGDSLTEKNLRTTKNYHDYIGDVTGINVINMGLSGTGYAKGASSNNAFYQRISNVPTNADVVTIFGSGNDMSSGLSLGTPTDTGTETLCGCINTTIDNIIAIMPAVSLGIVSPTPWVGSPPSNADSGMAKYCAAMKTICENRSIPFLDLYHCSNLRPWTEEGRAACYTKDDGNGVHPDEKGHALIAPRFKAFLETLIL